MPTTTAKGPKLEELQSQVEQFKGDYRRIHSQLENLDVEQANFQSQLHDLERRRAKAQERFWEASPTSDIDDQIADLKTSQKELEAERQRLQEERNEIVFQLRALLPDMWRCWAQKEIERRAAISAALEKLRQDIEVPRPEIEAATEAEQALEGLGGFLRGLHRREVPGGVSGRQFQDMRGALKKENGFQDLTEDEANRLGLYFAIRQRFWDFEREFGQIEL